MTVALYIADTYNSRIRKVDANGIISTVATIARPTAIDINGGNNLYVTNSVYNQVFKISPTGITTVIAGNGINGFSGDGEAATDATLNNPSGLDIDNSGNLYIADSGNNRVRKVDTNGIITTVAGNGVNDFGGDGGAATNASLRYPTGVLVDGSGRLYIADLFNNRIRQVTLGKAVVSVQNGDWLNGTTWDCGCVPTKDDVVTISVGHKVVVSQTVQAQVVKQKGDLLFDINGKVSF